MARTVFLCGHGAWNPKDGFFALPPNCSITFIVDVAKVLYTADMYKVCEGTYSGDSARVVGEPGASSRTCPNMTWTADEPQKITKCDQLLKKNPAGTDALLLFPNHIPNFLDANRSITLKKFFDDYWRPAAHVALGNDGLANFIWACCGYVELKPSAAGAALGVNAAQTHDRFDHINYAGKLALTGKSTPRS
jgi:hypothetical protein